MKWLEQLLAVLPVLAAATDNKIDDLAVKLIAAGEKEVSRRMAESGKTREEVLAENTEVFDRAIAKIDAGRKLGHEND